MLPSFMLKGGEVSRYVLGGADLMFPGILIPPQGFPSFSAGEIWAVKVPGNLAPIAVSLFIFLLTDVILRNDAEVFVLSYIMVMHVFEGWVYYNE